MITVDGLTSEFGGTTLFKDISFQINEKDRIALMGKNGAGKSTLLKIIAGVRTATRGSVSAPKDCVIAYLPQHLMTEDGRTVFEETCQAFAHLHEMQGKSTASTTNSPHVPTTTATTTCSSSKRYLLCQKNSMPSI